MDLTEKPTKLIRKKPRKKRKHQHRISKIRYIGIEFDPVKISACEKEVNDALSEGYEPIRDVDTPRGLVLVMGLWKPTK